jgi:hypothetical protein
MFTWLERRCIAALALIVCAMASAAYSVGRASTEAAHPPSSPDSAGVVWLCRPGIANNPCTRNLATTIVRPNGNRVINPTPAVSSPFDCFYVYGTASLEEAANADLRIGNEQIDHAVSEAAPFSPLCAVYAPIYRQVTVSYVRAHPNIHFAPKVTATAYDSIRAGFQDYLNHYNHGRPFIFISHSQGTAMLNMLIARFVDDNVSLRSRFVIGVLLGGNVEVPIGKLVGDTFKHIPACDRLGEITCVIAYSSFPTRPPSDALFGRPGQGVSLISGQTAKNGVEVVCVNPASMAGGSASLDSLFPSRGAGPTAYIAYPGLYNGECKSEDGASWLNVAERGQKTVVTQSLGPLWGYHLFDMSLGQRNLIADVAAAERSYSAREGTAPNARAH